MDSIAKIKTEDGNVNELIRALEKCEMEIRNEGIFSNNEDFEDVNEDQLEYFEYDYYLAKVYGRQRTSDIGDRLLLIEKVSLFYDAFLNRCELYGFVSKDSMEEHLSMMEGNRTRDAIRAYKINRYQLEKEMKTIQKNNKLDYRIGIQLSAMDAMDEQYALQQERALLEKVHVEHIKENIEFKHKPTPSTSGLVRTFLPLVYIYIYVSIGSHPHRCHHGNAKGNHPWPSIPIIPSSANHVTRRLRRPASIGS